MNVDNLIEESSSKSNDLLKQITPILFQYVLATEKLKQLSCKEINSGDQVERLKEFMLFNEQEVIKQMRQIHEI